MNLLLETDAYTLAAAGVDLVIILAVIALTRPLIGRILGVAATAELASADNFAFGIVLAGAGTAIAIMLSGVATGEFAPDLVLEATTMAGFAILGLVLLLVARWVLDKVVLRGLDTGAAVRAGNKSVAIVDAGNLIAIAIMLRALITLAEDDLATGLATTAIGFLAAQAILVASAAYRMKRFAQNENNRSLTQAIEEDNLALALRFAGFQAAVAIGATAITVDTGQPEIAALIDWTLGAACVATAVCFLSYIAEKTVLAGVNTSHEVEIERNVGVALVEAGLYPGVALVVVGLIAG